MGVNSSRDILFYFRPAFHPQTLLSDTLFFLKMVSRADLCAALNQEEYSVHREALKVHLVHTLVQWCGRLLSGTPSKTELRNTIGLLSSLEALMGDGTEHNASTPLSTLLTRSDATYLVNDVVRWLGITAAPFGAQPETALHTPRMHTFDTVLKATVAALHNAHPIGRVLSVAGSDSGGGAGIQADLKTCEAIGVFGMTALTALTAQNTCGVQGVSLVEYSFVEKQIESCRDIGVDVIKTGMLPDGDTVRKLAHYIATWDTTPRPLLVVDPVMISASGCSLAATDTAEALRSTLLREATLCTPNLIEARALLESEAPLHEFCPSVAHMEDIAKRIHERTGCANVLLKGGHFDEVREARGEGLPTESTDVLWQAGDVSVEFTGPWLATRNTHGTGCTLASAVAAYLAQGLCLVEAVRNAKVYVADTLSASIPFALGQGAHGPMLHSRVSQR